MSASLRYRNYNTITFFVSKNSGNSRYRNSAMSQRWLATVLLHCEKGCRRVKGYLGIAEVMAAIEQIQGEQAFQKAA